MKLWLIEQSVNTDYDVYDSAIVAANDPAKAMLIHPSGDGREWWLRESHGDWVNTPALVSVTLIGEAVDGTEAGVVLASFNAG